MKKPVAMHRQTFAQSGVPLALEPSAFGFGFEMSVQDEPEEFGPVAVVNIEGPLSFKAGWWFDSYEAIASRYEKAMNDERVKCIVLNINSPGGEAAGNFETVRKMRAMKTKPVIAVANESAYSAAYGLLCVADEAYLPESAGVGSVGVIAGMCDLTKMNESAGIRIEMITSGARKADGNPNVPITDAALSGLQGRVDQLADLFFDLVAESRGIDAEAVRALEAGCFYGADAVSKGLADGVMSFDEVLALAGETYAGADPMTKKLIDKKTETTKIAAATARKTASASRPKKDAKLSAPKEEDEECPGMSDGEEEEGDGEEVPPPADSTDNVEESEDCEGEDAEEDPEEEAAAIHESDVLALVKDLTGQSSNAGMIGMLHVLSDAYKENKSLKAQIAKLSKSGGKAAAVAAMVDAAISDGKVSPASRKAMIEMGMKAKESLSVYIANLSPKVVKMNGGEMVTKTPNAKEHVSIELTEAEKAFAKQTGTSLEAMAANKKKLVDSGLITH